MKRLILVGLLLFSSMLLVPAQSVQPFQIQWHRSFGGTNAEWTERIAVASDGGYMVAASSGSLLRLDQRGNKLWERNLGERFRDLKLTSNGEWILVGTSQWSTSGYGQADYGVARLDDQGNALWDKSYGGSSYDEAVAVIEAGGGEFIVAGYSYSGTNSVKTVASFGMADLWILRLSVQGDILWQTNYGTADQDWPYAMDRCGTNGFVIAAASAPGGNWDFWILAIDQDGRKLWEHSYGGDGTDEPFNIRQTSDGGFITCGWTSSGVSGNKTTPLAFPSLDCWIVRLNAAGEKVWERTFGHEDTDFPHGLLQTLDGGFVVSGSAIGSGGWTLRLDQNGNQVWEHKFEVGSDSHLFDIQSTQDGGVIAAGSTWSDSQRTDVLVMKLAPDSLTAPQLELLPNGTATPRQLTLRGISGRTYVAEGTEDFLSWLPFATNTLSSNSVEVLDPTPSPARRFYRAKMLP